MATGTRTFRISTVDTLAAGANRPTDLTLTGEISATQSWANGTAAGQINAVSYNKLTITPGSPSTPVTHDFDTMTGLAGTAVDFAHVRGIYATLTSGATGVECIIGNSGADAFGDVFMGGTTPSVKMQLGGVFAVDKPQGTNGWAVGTNNDDLKFDCGTFATTNAIVEVLYVGNA